MTPISCQNIIIRNACSGTQTLIFILLILANAALPIAISWPCVTVTHIKDVLDSLLSYWTSTQCTCYNSYNCTLMHSCLWRACTLSYTFTCTMAIQHESETNKLILVQPWTMHSDIMYSTPDAPRLTLALNLSLHLSFPYTPAGQLISIYPHSIVVLCFA